MEKIKSIDRISADDSMKLTSAFKFSGMRGKRAESLTNAIL